MEKEILGRAAALLINESNYRAPAFALIEAKKANYPVTLLCSNFGVSTSGYYDWCERREHPAPRTTANEVLTGVIREIHAQSRGTCGSRRVHAELHLGEGIHDGIRRVERLIRVAGIEGVYRQRKHPTTRRDPKAALNDDLVDRPDALWVGDVTEHPKTEGKVYLATVIHAYSRRVVGWSIADHLRAELVVDAFQMAIWRRRHRDPGTVMHTDHGSTAGLNRSSQHLDDGILGSMGTVGDALDNAMAESFFGTLQLELLDHRHWKTRAELASAIFEYVEAFYNPRRRHSSIGNLSPVEFETQHTNAAIAA